MPRLRGQSPILLAIILGLASACGGGGGGGTARVAGSAAPFSADPGEIVRGDSTKLVWDLEGVAPTVSVYLDSPDGQPVSPAGSSVVQGERLVTPRPPAGTGDQAFFSESHLLELIRSPDDDLVQAFSASVLVVPKPTLALASPGLVYSFGDNLDSISVNPWYGSDSRYDTAAGASLAVVTSYLDPVTGAAQQKQETVLAQVRPGTGVPVPLDPQYASFALALGIKYQKGLQATALCPVPVSVPGGFQTAVHGLQIPRTLHSATLLASGQILVAGGLTQPGGATRSAELYNPGANPPATGQSAATGSLGTARYGHSATALADGTVLVAGGVDASGLPLQSAEIYNPGNQGGSFAATPPMAAPRYLHTATLLQDHTVLLTGGVPPLGGTAPLASAEIYDPVHNTFTATGTMTVARQGHTATLLPSGTGLPAGTVLITGGLGPGGTVLDSAELYDPGSGTFTALDPAHGGTMLRPRSSHSATLLDDGTVLLAGGSGGPDAEVFDPGYAANTYAFRPTSVPMAAARSGQTASLLPNQCVLLAGGAGGGNQAERYTPFRVIEALGIPQATGLFDLFNPVQGLAAAPARLNHTATVLPGDPGWVILIGGEDAGGGLVVPVECFAAGP